MQSLQMQKINTFLCANTAKGTA